jgi:capsular polysaccharide biosynthesis protein
MLRRIKHFLAGLSGHLPPRLQRVLMDFAAFLGFKIWRPAVRAIPFYLLRKLPVSSAVLGPPKGLCTAEECCRHAGVYVPLRAAHEIRRMRLPAVLGGEVHPVFARNQRIMSPPTFVARIPGARVYGDCGAVITPDDRLLEEVSIEVTRSGFTHSVFSRYRLSSATSLDGLSAVLATSGRMNYSHWMFDTLPRLRLLREAGIRLEDVQHFLVGEFGARFQRETAEILGIPAGRFVPCSASAHYRCGELLVPSLAGVSGHPPAWVGDFLRETFLGADTPVPPAGAGRKIYVSRAGARFRRVLNEEEVTRALTAVGFEVVRLETLSVREEARLFASADVVVAPHGAGCANAVFCRPGTAFIEIFSPRYIHPPFWVICSQRRLRYAYAAGRWHGPEQEAHYFTMLENIDVDCEKLLRTIDLCTSLPPEPAPENPALSD